MHRHRGRRRLLALVTGAVIVAPWALTAPPSARATNATVIERGVQYAPAQVTVSVGDTVSWIYESSPAGSPGHTVTFSDRDLNPNCPPQLLFNDCQRGPGDRVSRTFGAPGTYPYYCKIHRGQGMTGVVIVTAVTSTATTAPKSSTTTTVRASSSSTTTTARATSSSTTTTTRALATSSTALRSSTTTSDPSSAVV